MFQHHKKTSLVDSARALQNQPSFPNALQTLFTNNWYKIFIQVPRESFSKSLNAGEEKAKTLCICCFATGEIMNGQSELRKFLSIHFIRNFVGGTRWAENIDDSRQTMRFRRNSQIRNCAIARSVSYEINIV